jgi:iron complex outermembrane recepter protein
MGPQLSLAGIPVATQDQFTQEFQLQSGDDARAPWTLGFYYIDLQEAYEPTRYLYGGSYSAQRGGLIAQSLRDYGRASSYAVYAQAAAPIGQRTRLTGGVRHTIEDRSVQAAGERLYDTAPFVRPIPGLPSLSEPMLQKKTSFQELTWRASLERDFTESVMGYLSANRGFQSGGWNLQTPQSPAFGPETIIALEGGLKFLARSGRLKGDLSVFHYDYSDLQVSAFTPLGSVTTNAASAKIRGVEMQVEQRLGEATGFTFGAQLLDARFNQFPNATCTNYDQAAAAPYAPMSCDVTGNRLPFAPRSRFNLGADHRVSLGDRGDLILSANLAYSAGYFSEADNIVRQQAFTIVDVSAEWKRQDGASIRLWIANATDARYYDTLVTFPTAGVLQRPSAPRRFGVTISADF